ncbi:MAG: hypothetical protein FWF53_00860 [Candidatus Azobacteroides sp.]|nr:hypothetical protein [Candidatus Azobacteroides sp.]
MGKIDLVQSVILPLSRLEVNKGQIEDLPANPRFIRDERYRKLKISIQENPDMLSLRELLVFEQNDKYVIIGGNMRYRAMKELGYIETPCKIISSETPIETLKAYTIKDNAGFGEWDFDMLANEWDTDYLNKWGVEMNFLKDDPEDTAKKAEEKQITKLVETFIIPPFSVLNTRAKEWQERRKQWLDLGIKSELGRKENITYSSTSQPPVYYLTKNNLKDRLNRIPTHEEIAEELEKKGIKMQSTVSVFDPVLTEISYRWFNVKNGTILDPFAGGSVRGIVAAKLGMQYVGNDLRKEQIKENKENAKIVLYDLDGRNFPIWTSGDSLRIDEILKAEKIESRFDMIFSCPPYADLEVYSDDKRDLSNMEYRRFLETYREIIKKSCSLLKENRFAVFTVGDVRDKYGVYRNFVGDTIQAFTDCGLKYYNHFILVNQINSLVIRIRRQFNASRKAGKTHQNVLAFFKGDTGEMPNTFEKINIKKAIEQFNASKEATEITEDVICFYKGDVRKINEHFHSFDSSVQPAGDVSELIKVKVSGKWIRHKFMCSVDYIKNVCHGSCCTGSNRVLVSLLPNEADYQQSKGFSVKNNLLQADFKTGKCPHIDKAGFCALHGTSNKPFGCIASPFTLNSANTLIIRNRYNMMKCHGTGDYAFRVFRSSLNLIFGENEAQRICDYYESNDGDLEAWVPRENYNKLTFLDSIKEQ